MKTYLKVVMPIFTAVLVYSVLALIFGPKGLLAFKQLEIQKEKLLAHLDDLYMTANQLDACLANLSYDSDTIAMYARDLGYVYEQERLIKLVNYQNQTAASFSPGNVLTLQKIDFLSDYGCKTAAVSCGIVMVLIQMLLEKKHAYRKKEF